MGFRASDPRRNVMGQNTEMSLLVVCMLCWTFLNPLNVLYNMLVYCCNTCTSFGEISILSTCASTAKHHIWFQLAVCGVE